MKKLPEIMDKEVPLIKGAFVKTMVEEYDMDEEKAKEVADPFIQVFIDATNYGFSINHSDAYSYLGYACAYLKYYYPLEFITASLEVNKGKEDKTNRLKQFALSKGIKIREIKYGFSSAEYSFDKDTNSIYQGIEPIKYMNRNVANSLYDISKEKDYDNFLDLLIAIFDRDIYNYDLMEMLTKDLSEDELKEVNKEMKTVKPMESIGNKRQLSILIDLDFFDKFGKSGKLKECLEIFNKRYNKKHKLKTKRVRYQELKEEFDKIEDEHLGFLERVKAQVEYLGYTTLSNDRISFDYYIIKEIIELYNTRVLKLHNIKMGKSIELKSGSRMIDDMKVKAFDIVSIKSSNIEKRAKVKKIDGKYQETDEVELWVSSLSVIHKNEDKE